MDHQTGSRSDYLETSCSFHCPRASGHDGRRKCLAFDSEDHLAFLAEKGVRRHMVAPYHLLLMLLLSGWFKRWSSS